MTPRDVNLQLALDCEEAVPGLEIARQRSSDGGEYAQLGGACPWQAWGALHGHGAYFRFRHNQASCTVYDGPDTDGLPLLSAVIYPYDPEGDDLDGWISPEEAVRMVKRLVEELRPVSEENPTSVMIMARQMEELLKARGWS